MELDDKVCLCFHVTRRKLLQYLRVHRPKVASQLSLCGGAGTGCGWCVPFLKQLHRQHCTGERTELESLSAEEYAQRRRLYIGAGIGKPPSTTEETSEGT